MESIADAFLLIAMACIHDVLKQHDQFQIAVLIRSFFVSSSIILIHMKVLHYIICWMTPHLKELVIYPKIHQPANPIQTSISVIQVQKLIQLVLEKSIVLPCINLESKPTES